MGEEASPAGVCAVGYRNSIREEYRTEPHLLGRACRSVSMADAVEDAACLTASCLSDAGTVWASGV